MPSIKVEDFAPRVKEDVSSKASGNGDAFDVSEATVSECLERQEDEILAMSGIYDVPDEDEESPKPKCFTVLKSPPQSNRNENDGQDGALVELRMPVEFSPPRSVLLIRAGPPGDEADNWQILREISHLPPLEIKIKMPNTYPSHNPPKVHEATSPWLSSDMLHARAQLSWIQRRIEHIWEDLTDRSESLMMVAEWLGEGMWRLQDDDSEGHPFLIDSAQAEKARQRNLAQESDEDLLETIVFQDATSSLAQALTHFSKHQTLALFGSSRFNCSICLESVKGRLCTRLSSCGHVFCTPCLQDYISMLVREGSWRQASECPDLDCVKARSDKTRDANSAPVGFISKDELVTLVGKELADRHDWLALKAAAETDPNASYCPIDSCGGIARGEAKDAGTWSEGLRICTSCEYAFCRFCEKAWHAKEPCALLTISMLIEEYNAFEEGSEEKRAFEAKYGYKNIQRIKKIYEDEAANRKWIMENSTRCPCCNVPVEKSDGCNHMSCRACNGHFCFLCGATLSAHNPYQHFNTPGHPCYQKLFHGLEARNQDEWEPFDAEFIAVL